MVVKKKNLNKNNQDGRDGRERDKDKRLRGAQGSTSRSVVFGASASFDDGSGHKMERVLQVWLWLLILTWWRLRNGRLQGWMEQHC